MAIADITATAGPTGFLSTYTWSHTCAGSNRVIYVRLAQRFNSAVTGVTYAGTALTRLAQQKSPSDQIVNVELWRLVNPASGANNVSVALSTARYVAASAVSMSGVDQATSDGTPVVASNNSSSPSVSVSSATDQVVVDVVAVWTDAGTVTASATGGQTVDSNAYNGNSTNNGVRGVHSHITGAASTAMSYSLSGATEWAEAAVAVLPLNTGGAGSGGGGMLLLGVG